MTVLELGANKLLISLTHTEVLCCFYSYERLSSLSGSVKTAIKFLIQGIAEGCLLEKGIPLTASIKVINNNGCKITVTQNKPVRKTAYKTYVLDFACNEDLTSAIIMLYRRGFTKRLLSSLYKTDSGYRLIIKTKNSSALNGTDEFYENLTLINNENCIDNGKLLIEDNAILKYGKIFSKGI